MNNKQYGTLNVFHLVFIVVYYQVSCSLREQLCGVQAAVLPCGAGVFVEIIPFERPPEDGLGRIVLIIILATVYKACDVA